MYVTIHVIMHVQFFELILGGRTKRGRKRWM